MLLDSSTLTEGDKNIARSIMSFVALKERSSPEIEQEMKKHFDGITEHKVRSVLFLMENEEIVRWVMRIVQIGRAHV
jgi:hypothetical protein